MNSYELSRKWFDWSFENPEKISPNHSALYFFAIEHCNRLGWRKKFGFPTEMAKDAIGIKSYGTYIKTLNDLVSWGFIEMIEKSKNQYSANIIALSNFDKALDKALDKAIVNHMTKQDESISSIDKPITNNQEQLLIMPEKQKMPIESIIDRKLKFSTTLIPFLETYDKDLIRAFCDYWTEHGDKDKKMRFEKEKSFGLARRLATWKKNNFGNTNTNKKQTQDELTQLTNRLRG